VQKKIIIDTSTYIDIFNSGQYEHLKNPFQYVVSRPGFFEIDSPHEARFRMGNIASYPAPLDT